MAVRFNGTASNRLTISSAPLDANSAYTICGWLYVSASTGANAVIFNLGSDGNNRDQVRISSSGTSFSAAAAVGGAGGAGSGTAAVSVGSWYHVALVRESATSLKLYVNGSLDVTRTTDVSARAATTTMNCGVEFTVSPLNGRLAFAKAWSVSLTAAEVVQELQLGRPSRLASLYGWWPMLNGSGERTRDYSGNAHDWAEVGTLTDEDPPPVAWGAARGRRLAVASSAAVNTTDSASLSDASALAVSLATTDSGAASEASSVANLGTVVITTDAGSLSDASSVAASTSRTESGALGESGVVSVVIVLYPWAQHTFPLTADDLARTARRDTVFTLTADDLSRTESGAIRPLR